MSADAERPSFQIDTARDGVPLTAHCAGCGEQWTRPPGDDRADSLVSWGRAHRCKT